MGFEFTEEIAVQRPREEVAAFLEDPRNEPRWIPAFREVRVEGDRVIRVGSYRGVEHVLRVVAREPGRRFELESAGGPVQMRVAYEFLECGEGTVVRVRTSGAPVGCFYKLTMPLVLGTLRTEMQANLGRLKTLLERST